MIFVYTSDLHGNIDKYKKVLLFSLEQKVSLIHLGGDILVKGSDIMGQQKKFINGYLKEFYEKCHKHSVDVIASFGNDDLYIHKKYFRKYATLLDEIPYHKDGYEFIAYNFVDDYPFGLKTACKIDRNGWKCQEPYISEPVDVDEQGFYEIENVEEYFRKKGTIEDDLKLLKATNKTIMAMHMPPSGVGLDVCYGGRRVGSKAIYDWICREKPPLFLCGHIHESPAVSNTWKANIGKSIVIQPGQLPDKTTLVVIEIGESVLTNIIDIQ